MNLSTLKQELTINLKRRKINLISIIISGVPGEGLEPPTCGL